MNYPFHTRPQHPCHEATRLFDSEMAKIRVTVEEMKTKHPSRRSRSAPYSKPANDPVRRKRARSETCLREEPVRTSKRLRGIAADSMEEEAVFDVAVFTGGWGIGSGKEGTSRRKFGRTLSAMTSSTMPDEEESSQSTLPDDEGVPANARLSSQSITEVSSCSSNGAQEMAATSNAIPLVVSQELVPVHSSFPPVVLIDGYPSLRIKFRGTCLYRRRAQLPTLEWQSHYFFQHINDEDIRTALQKELSRDGFIRIPNNLFDSSDQDTLGDFFLDFFERYALPKQPLPTFADFIDPSTKILNAKRISWWKLLADYLHIPHYLDKILNTSPGNWHIVYHSLPTFTSIRDFSIVIESLGLKRAREAIHQELARRIALVRGKGRIKETVQFDLLKMGYEELRELSTQFEHLEREYTEKIMGSCIMCCVQPAFLGDTMRS